MKKHLHLLISLLPLLTLAQTSVYHPFPDSNAVWNGEFGGGLILCSEYYSYVINGDTAIGAHTYHKLYIPYVQTIGTCGAFHSAGYNGCLRQDTIARKVFYVAQGSTNEVLLYDFNLLVGDTVYGFNRFGCTQMTDTVNQIDSVLIGTNYRKRWHTGSFPNTSMIIEGIGYTSGLLEGCGSNFPDVSVYRLDCFQQNGITLYPDATTTCGVIDDIESASPKNISATLFPNPFHTSSLFNMNSDIEGAELRIYNSNGEKVKRQIIINKLAIINREGLSDGIYFFVVINDNLKILSGKFIIE